MIPRVTEIIGEVLSGSQWMADEFYLQRGTAVHACCALVLAHSEFTCDERITGQVQACRNWMEMYKPEVLHIEERRTHKIYQYTGMPDLVCKINGKRTIVDWKASIAPTVNFQLGAYGLMFDCKYGMAVQLKEDGTFKTDGLVKMDIPGRKFLAILTVYKIKHELGLIKGGKE